MSHIAFFAGVCAEALLFAMWGRSLLTFVLGSIFLFGTRKPAARPEAILKPASVDLTALVPAYNESASIERTIDCLAEALGQGRRLIVVDDGSADDTADKVEAMAVDGAVTLIRLAQNGGKANALNVGLNAVGSGYVLTVDADTFLDRASVDRAVADMEATNADAISFWIDVDRSQKGLLPRLQALEYAMAMNFERAAQSLIGSISVMPGAATLYRASALPEVPFSSRTATEDADLTLYQVRQAKRLVLSRHSLAGTLAPETVQALLRQRRRWTLGHLQCVILHMLEPGGTRRFRYFTLPNFVLATLSPIIPPIALFIIASLGEAPVSHMTVMNAFWISTALVYGQRLVSFMVLKLPFADAPYALIEPVTSGFLQGLAFVMALSKLVRFRRGARPQWAKVRWR